ncbi:TetR family transcriptional regulator [Phyllobacterium sp. TAF24]|uniref:TetR family transcriptional regulator n=1 Tax=Phyllobacterium sp. TAF24 TaxID=3233068 RepID=UPI003F945011
MKPKEQVILPFPESTDDDAETRRRPQQKRSKQRVDAILEATFSLIGEKGIDAVTMKEIATRIGSPISTLYQYFPNKSAILASLYQNYAVETRETILNAVRDFKNFDDMMNIIYDLLDRYYERVRNNPAIQDLLNAVVADKTLHHIDIADSRDNAEIIAKACAGIVQPEQSEMFDRAIFMIAHLNSSVARLSLGVDDDEAKRVLDDYKLLVRIYMKHFMKNG